MGVGEMSGRGEPEFEFSDVGGFEICFDATSRAAHPVHCSPLFRFQTVAR